MNPPHPNTLEAAFAAPEWLLPAHYRASVGPLRHRCPCQWGPSGHCLNGDHDRCPRTEGWHRHGQPEPETRVIGRTGGALTEVWRAGTPCRWLCPCACHEHVRFLFAVPAGASTARSGRKGDDRYLRVATTDHLDATAPPAPTLF